MKLLFKTKNKATNKATNKLIIKIKFKPKLKVKAKNQYFGYCWSLGGGLLWLSCLSTAQGQASFVPFSSLEPSALSSPSLLPLPLPHSVVAEAQAISGSNQDTVYLRGQATLQRDDLHVQAPSIDVCLNRSEISATGGVIVQNKHDFLRALDFKFNTLTEAGTATQPEYFVASTHGRANARTVTFTGQQQTILDHATYTSCQPQHDDWLLKADTLVLDDAMQTGTARGMSVRFMNVPIFASPYFEFPLGNERRSGFLTPKAGYNSVSGVELSVPYYFNWARNHDATLTVRQMSRRGLQLTGNQRYLMPSMQGQAQIDWLPRDNVLDKQRWSISLHQRYQQNLGLNHAFEPSKYWSGGLTLQRVSDDTFFADLSTASEAGVPTGLLSEVWANYHAPWGQVEARASQYQTLQDSAQSIVPAYARLPEVSLALKPVVLTKKLGGLTFDFKAQATRFTHPTLTQGLRLYALPTLSQAWLPHWGFFKSKLQLNLAQYSQLTGFNYQGVSRFSRAIPMASLDTGLIFERTTTWLAGGLPASTLHTLEPRLYFLYVPFKDQANAPVFDSALSSFSLAQIFSDNVFTGQDRIANAAHVTPALTTQWTDIKTGALLLKATVGKRYYFDPQRVTLTGASLPDMQGSAIASSDWLLAAVGQPLSSLSVDAALQYNQTQRAVVNSAYTLRYTQAARQFLSLSRRFTKDLQDAIEVAGQWQIAPNQAILGKISYSLGVPSLNLSRGMTETLLGYEYDAGCWTFKIAANRYINTANVKATSFYFQLDLSGLTQVGSGSTNTLRKQIPGYSPFEGKPTWTYDGLRPF